MMINKFHKYGIAFPWFLFLIFSLGDLHPQGSETMKTIKIALCQIFSLDGDRSGNFVRIEQAMREAKQSGAEMICFPESMILGWVNRNAHTRAFPIPGEDSDRLCVLARKYDAYLCVGLDEKEGERLYDSVILIDEKGTILLKHRKINVLPELMTPPYSVGSEVRAAQTRFGTIGLLICADTFLPDALKRMAELKPDLVLVPYGWAAKEEAWPGHGKSLADTVSKAAKVIGAPVIGTNLVGEITQGPWTGQVYGGQSIAADPDGGILLTAKDRDRDVQVISVSLGRP